jgi:hypothetical protein
MNEKNNTENKGKILRVKTGYNPNSSSMGSIVFLLPATVIGVTVAFGAVSSVIMSCFIKDNDNSNKNVTSQQDCQVQQNESE